MTKSQYAEWKVIVAKDAVLAMEKNQQDKTCQCTNAELSAGIEVLEDTIGLLNALGPVYDLVRHDLCRKRNVLREFAQVRKSCGGGLYHCNSESCTHETCN